MKRLPRGLFVALMLALSSCGSETQTTSTGTGSTKTSPVKSGSASAKTSASVAKPPASGSAGPTASASSSADAGDEKKGKMANCPAAAPNAKVEFKEIPKGIEITVTAADKADVEEIKKRAKDVADRAKGEGGKAQHSGEGGGGGAQGRCPIVLGGTDVTVADVDNGSKFTVVAKDEKEVDWLRREAKERHAAMSDAGAGAGKMANCPSAVKGAKTTVKEDKGNIVATVVAKDEAATKDIRERAKKVAEIKHEKPTKGEHGGQGAGAEEGRCPVVLPGTTATAKDVEGGSEITLKPGAGGDAKKLLKEAQDRAARFD